MMRVPNDGDIDVGDPITLDRLVDGELTEAEERAVIARLGETPDGWQRCALAFLEARWWQRAARQICDFSARGKDSTGRSARDAARVQTHPDMASRPSASPRWDASWSSTLALCGLFLLAFAIGAFMPLPWQGPGSHHSGQPSGSTDMATRESRSSVDRGVAPRKEPVNSQDLLVGNLTLVDNSGRTFDVPVYEWNERVAEKLMYHSQPLSPEFFEQLRRHQVRSHQSYLPVKLRDGRQVVVPVQELEILPVGGAAY